MVDIFSHIQPELEGSFLQLDREAFISHKQAVNPFQCRCPLMGRKRITLKQRSFTVTMQSEKKKLSCVPLDKRRQIFFTSFTSKDKIRKELNRQGEGQTASKPAFSA